MMGMPLSAEEHKRIGEKIAARREAVARSLGKTADELGCAHGVASVHAPAVEPEDVPDVDEEAVLAYLRSRQGIIDKQRARIRALESQVAHLEAERDLAQKKVATLRDALAKMKRAAPRQGEGGAGA